MLSTAQLREQLSFPNPGAFYLLRNATLPDKCASSKDESRLFDIGVREGRIASVSRAGREPVNGHAIDLAGRMVWPRFVDIHTHLDKGHVLARTGQANGTLDDAISVISRDRAQYWSADDLAARIDFSLRSAWHYGTSLVRTHIDSHPGQWQISWDVFEDVRRNWRGRIALQGASLVPIPLLRDEAYADALARRVAKAGGIFGAVVFDLPDLPDLLDRMFRLARKHGLNLDFHADETGDADSNTLLEIAQQARAHGNEIGIVAGHCCSLSLLGGDDLRRTLDAVREAGIAIVSLPACNLYLQDRKGRDITPHWRGLTAFKEARSMGVDVALASDNTRDPFHLFGDLDMLDTFRLGVRSLHLDDPVDRWLDTVTSTPTRMAGAAVPRIAPGEPADFIIFEGRTFSEVLARSEADRIVMGNGAMIASSLPTYSELDGLRDNRSF